MGYAMGVLAAPPWGAARERESRDRMGARADGPVDRNDWELIDEARRVCRHGKVAAPHSPHENNKAFAVLFDRYAASVYSFLLRLTRDAALADDLTQETFLAAYRHLDRLRPERAAGGPDGTLRPWLLRVARNLAASHLRRPASREVAQADVPALLEGHSPAGESPVAESPANRSPAPGPEEAVLQSETLDEVRRAVGSLPAAYREPILLHYSAGLSYAEIGITLGLPLGTVATRIRRGLARVAAALDRERWEETP